jgi:hypothetical protein
MNNAMGWAGLAVGCYLALNAVLGAAYIADCRRFSSRLEPCWARGLQIAGLGSEGQLFGVAIGSTAGWLGGYNTLNPNLRRPDRDKSEEA